MRRAFTLAELLVVVVILTIAAAMIVPQVTGMGELRSRSAARLILADLEYAQSRAILDQADTTVTFSTTGNDYTLTDSSTSTPLVHPITKKTYAVDFAQTKGLEDVSIDSANFGGGASVTFDALGGPDPPQGGTVTVIAGTHGYQVTVEAVTGQVTVTKVP